MSLPKPCPHVRIIEYREYKRNWKVKILPTIPPLRYFTWRPMYIYDNISLTSSWKWEVFQISFLCRSACLLHFVVGILSPTNAFCSEQGFFSWTGIIPVNSPQKLIFVWVGTASTYLLKTDLVVNSFHWHCCWCYERSSIQGPNMVPFLFQPTGRKTEAKPTSET